MSFIISHALLNTTQSLASSRVTTVPHPLELQQLKLMGIKFFFRTIKHKLTD